MSRAITVLPSRAHGNNYSSGVQLEELQGVHVPTLFDEEMLFPKSCEKPTTKIGIMEKMNERPAYE